MSGTVSTRWYFTDWMSDQNVRACGLAARGLWMDLLCIASANKGKDHGFVMIAGRGMGASEIARHVGSTPDEIEPLLDELERNEVFSKDRRGFIYCRRMVRAEKNRTNGRLGGNPNLLKNKETQEPVQPEPKAHIPEPVPEPSLFADARTAKPPRELTKLEIERKGLFDRGKEVLGQNAGGMINQLLAVKHGNIAHARAAIEQASQMDDPRQYIGAITRGTGNGKTQGTGGFALATARVRQAAAARTDGESATPGTKPPDRH